MEIYRKQLDKKILESIKNKIYKYLQSKGLENIDFFKSNMDAVEGLYVENLKEQRGSRMISRSARSNKPSEIAIDKVFVEFDKNDNPIKLDINCQKLIESQLGHELIHSAARYNGVTGIIYSGKNKRTLNEGITQMITEDVFGYTVSPNGDGYRDYKKVAKILKVTLGFGERVILKDYFNRTGEIERKCNLLAKDENFYESLNDVLSSMRDIQKKEEATFLYEKIRKNMLQKLCISIIIPRLKSLRKETQTKYIEKVLEAVKDDDEIRQQISTDITKFANMDDMQLVEQKSKIEGRLSKLQQAKAFVVELYRGDDYQKLVTATDEGEISLKSNSSIKINNQALKEKVLAQLYFQENNYSEERKKDFEDNTYKLLQEVKEGKAVFSFSKKRNTSLDRMKFFSARKVSAKKNGYIILNLLSECESGEQILLDMIQIPENGKSFDFQDLKRIYEKYKIEYENAQKTIVVKDRQSGQKIDDSYLSMLAKFANIWAGAAGTKWLLDEKIPGITYAFSEESEEVYNQISSLINKSMTETGMIDTKMIYDIVSRGGYKYSRNIVFELFKNQTNLKMVYAFYKKHNPLAKLETELAETTSEFVMGIDSSEYIASQAQEIVDAISVNDINNRCISQGIHFSEIKKAHDVLQSNMQQGKGVMPSAPNNGGNR